MAVAQIQIQEHKRPKSRQYNTIARKQIQIKKKIYIYTKKNYYVDFTWGWHSTALWLLLWISMIRCDEKSSVVYIILFCI